MQPSIATRLAALAIAALAGGTAATPSLAAATAAAGPGDGCAGTPPTISRVVADPYAEIRAHLDSEYLRDLASDWYPAVVIQVFDPGSPAFIRARLDSEYLRGISADWYPELLACAGPVD
jgi:hypothetical protein